MLTRAADVEEFLTVWRWGDWNDLPGPLRR